MIVCRMDICVVILLMGIVFSFVCLKLDGWCLVMVSMVVLMKLVWLSNNSESVLMSWLLFIVESLEFVSKFVWYELMVRFIGCFCIRVLWVVLKIVVSWVLMELFLVVLNDLNLFDVGCWLNWDV